MRTYGLFVSALLLALPVGGQTFRGSITMRMTGPGSGEPATMVMHHDGSGKQAIVMTGTTGPMAGSAVRVVVNPTSNQMTMFIEMPGSPAGGKGMKMVTPMPTNESGAGNSPNVTVKPLGTSQTIAGMRCDDFEAIKNGESTRLCITEELGRFAMPDMGDRNGTQAWVKAFGNRPVFPLKVWTTDGKVALEVTGVDRGRPDAALFAEDTPGFMTVPGGGMPGMRRN